MSVICEHASYCKYAGKPASPSSPCCHKVRIKILSNGEILKHQIYGGTDQDGKTLPTGDRCTRCKKTVEAVHGLILDRETGKLYCRICYRIIVSAYRRKP